MKRIDLKKIAMNLPGLDNPELCYASQIAEVLRAPMGQQGVTMDDVLLVTPVLKKAVLASEKNATAITLEDAEYKLFMERLAVFRFGVVDPAIAEFITDMQAAADVPMNVPPDDT